MTPKKNMIPSKEEYGKLSPEEKRKSFLDYYVSMWMEKDAYIREEMQYINDTLKHHQLGKWEDIGRFGELCYVLSKKDDVDIDGENWCRIYFVAKIFYKTFHPAYQQEEKMRTLEILMDVLQTPILIKKLGINFEDGVKYSRELMEDIKKITHDTEIHPKPQRWNNSWLINRLADDIFISMWEQDLPSNDSIYLLMETYKKYEYFDYDGTDRGFVKYKRLETQRTRAIKPLKDSEKNQR